MLALETFALDDVALMLAPATGRVAVVDARARTILEGLRAGQDQDTLALACAAATGGDVAAAAAQVAQLRRMWLDLATPVRPAVPRLPSPSAGAAALDALCRIGPAPVRLRVWPPRLARILGAVTAACHDPRGPAGVGSAVLDVRRVGGHYVLRADGHHFLATRDLMIARSEALRWLVLASHPGRKWLAVLHGAAVAGPAGAALLCGFSGAGKSTLTALLAASGLGLVTDDYAPIEYGSRLLWPVPFGLSVKEGSWDLLAPHFPELARAPVIRTRHRRQRYLAPPARADRPQAVARLIFPLYQAGAAMAMTALRPGEVLQILAGSGGWYESSRERLDDLVDWIRATPAHALVYGRAADAIDAVHRLLAV